MVFCVSQYLLILPAFLVFPAVSWALLRTKQAKCSRLSHCNQPETALLLCFVVTLSFLVSPGFQWFWPVDCFKPIVESSSQPKDPDCTPLNPLPSDFNIKSLLSLEGLDEEETRNEKQQRDKRLNIFQAADVANQILSCWGWGDSPKYWKSVIKPSDNNMEIFSSALKLVHVLLPRRCWHNSKHQTKWGRRLVCCKTLSFCESEKGKKTKKMDALGNLLWLAFTLISYGVLAEDFPEPRYFLSPNSCFNPVTIQPTCWLILT